MIALTGGLLILLGLLNIFSLGNRAITQGGRLAEITQNGRIALERMSRELRQAEELVVALPETSTVPAHEIQFQDGHDPTSLTYIRYYLSGNALHREVFYYSRSAAPTIHVHFQDINPDGSPATKTITEDTVIAEYIATLSLWGNQLINISLTVVEGATSSTLTTILYGRNLH